MEPREFFQRVRDSHAEAVERIGSTKLCLELAGRAVNITCASEALADRLSPALAHCRTDGGSRQETMNILAWDSKSSGVRPPKPPWGPHDYRQRGHIRGFNRDGIRTAFHGGANVLSLFEESTGTAVFWTPDATALPDYQIGSPYLIILHWWAETQGLMLVHSGAVGNQNGGVLLAGAGGSGKSTTALACIGASGLSYVSDDYCLLETSSGYRAHSVYSSGKLDDYSLSLLPRFKPMASRLETGDGEKSIIFLARHLSGQLVASLPVKTILLPHASGKDATRLRRASPADALLALAPSTIFQLTGAGGQQLAELGKMVRHVPSYHLDLSRDMRDTAEVVATILDRPA